jgi:hypothetical protein
MSGIIEREVHSTYSLELTTDCHGDYRQAVIQLTSGSLAGLMNDFSRLGVIRSWMPDLYLLDKEKLFRVLFSLRHDRISITLRKEAKGSAIDLFRDILSARPAKAPFPPPPS